MEWETTSVNNLPDVFIGLFKCETITSDFPHCDIDGVQFKRVLNDGGDTAGFFVQVYIGDDRIATYAFSKRNLRIAIERYDSCVEWIKKEHQRHESA